MIHCPIGSHEGTERLAACWVFVERSIFEDREYMLRIIVSLDIYLYLYLYLCMYILTVIRVIAANGLQGSGGKEENVRGCFHSDVWCNLMCGCTHHHLRAHIIFTIALTFISTLTLASCVYRQDTHHYLLHTFDITLVLSSSLTDALVHSVPPWTQPSRCSTAPLRNSSRSPIRWSPSSLIRACTHSVNRLVGQ